MTKTELFTQSLDVARTAESKMVKYYNLGHMHGMIDAAFDLPDWVESEHFAEFLLRSNMNPFKTSIWLCLAEYETYTADLFID